MFCRKCGYELLDDANFCPKCGEKVERVEEPVKEEPVKADSEETKTEDKGVVYELKPIEHVADYTEDVDGKEKINWRDLITLDNIERFAPIAALIPLAMAVLVSFVGKLLFLVFGSFLVGRAFCLFLMFILKAAFIVATGAAASGLIYVVITRKDTELVRSWITPIGTIAAFLSCVGMAFNWGGAAWLFGVISVAMGLEFFIRIVIAGYPIDSPMDPEAAINAYKRMYENYKEKYSEKKETVEAERAAASDEVNTVDTQCTEVAVKEDVPESVFDGTGLDLFGLSILTVILCIITLGLATPWMICKIYSWKTSHTVINGKRLTFTGMGGSLLGHWILWELLIIVTAGIYGFFVHVAIRKWALKHTFIEGEPIVPESDESYFDGGSFAYFGYGLLSGLLLLITCCLAFPWVMSILQKWDTKHQVINGRRLVFDGSGLGFLGEFIVIFFLSIITLGIYSSWGMVRMNKYIVRHTSFAD